MHARDPAEGAAGLLLRMSVVAAAAAAVTYGIGDALLGGTAKALAACPARALTLHTRWWQEPQA